MHGAFFWERGPLARLNFNTGEPPALPGVRPEVLPTNIQSVYMCESAQSAPLAKRVSWVRGRIVGLIIRLQASSYN